MKCINKFNEVMYRINNPCIDRSRRETKIKLVKYISKKLGIMPGVTSLEEIEAIYLKNESLDRSF